LSNLIPEERESARNEERKKDGVKNERQKDRETKRQMNKQRKRNNSREINEKIIRDRHRETRGDDKRKRKMGKVRNKSKIVCWSNGRSMLWSQPSRGILVAKRRASGVRGLTRE
jgi:hypothetical protein